MMFALSSPRAASVWDDAEPYGWAMSDWLVLQPDVPVPVGNSAPPLDIRFAPISPVSATVGSALDRYGTVLNPPKMPVYAEVPASA